MCPNRNELIYLFLKQQHEIIYEYVQIKQIIFFVLAIRRKLNALRPTKENILGKNY